MSVLGAVAFLVLGLAAREAALGTGVALAAAGVRDEDGIASLLLTRVRSTPQVVDAPSTSEPVR
jgi:hypothetical protein